MSKWKIVSTNLDATSEIDSGFTGSLRVLPRAIPLFQKVTTPNAVWIIAISQCPIV